MNTFFGGAIGTWEIVLIVAAVCCLAFWVWMIVDCAVYETRPGTKVAWLLVIVLGWIIGAPLYYVARKLPRYFTARTPKTPDVPIA